MTARHYTNSQNLVTSFDYSWFLGKTFLILYTMTWNSITCIAMPLIKENLPWNRFRYVQGFIEWQGSCIRKNKVCDKVVQISTIKKRKRNPSKSTVDQKMFKFWIEIRTERFGFLVRFGACPFWHGATCSPLRMRYCQLKPISYSINSGFRTSDWHFEAMGNSKKNAEFMILCTVWPQPIWIKVRSLWQIPPQHQSTYLGCPESASIEIPPFRPHFIKFQKYFFLD